MCAHEFVVLLGIATSQNLEQAVALYKEDLVLHCIVYLKFLFVEGK